MGETTGSGENRTAGRRRWRLLSFAVLVALLVPAAALAAFPGTDPDESPRVNTPNDRSFDRCENDNEEAPPDCQSYFEEDFRLFGFSPDSANNVPVNGSLAHYLTGTRYLDCDQLDEQGRQANIRAEGLTAAPQPVQEQAGCLQIAGIRADTAWKYSTGDPDTAVAILDTGIEWQRPELIDKVRLNRGELPLPQTTGGATCPAYDCTDPNDAGAFSVSDYANDPRVQIGAGDTEADGVLDASDLIATFSDGGFASGGIEGGVDDDGNGYVDDIAGWDFFDDDNDPFDASSCCSADGHGSDRAEEAVAETNNVVGSPGVCPDCQVMPLRIWDTFVTPTDNFAMATVYAADNGASVVEGAVGGLTNTQFARRSFAYADERGVALTLVSSDINSANHNYPTNYNEAIYVGGTVPDTAPNDTCTGPGGLGPVPGPPDPSDGQFEEGCDEFLGMLAPLDIAPSLQPTTTSFFRNANLTQYGGKADIVLVGATGSANTGQASGAAALLASFGRERFGDDDPLSGNEIRQLLTMTAEDVRPLNTGAIGPADRANIGWDSHFGYGRVNLAGAMARIDEGRIPPEAQLNAPDWFTPINVDRVPDGGVRVDGLAATPHGDGVGAWQVDYACGQDAADADFQPVPGMNGTGEVDGQLGFIPKSLLVGLADTCNGEVLADPGRPAGSPADGAWPADPYPNPDPERHAFQIRLTVRETGDAANIGRYRKTLFAYNDDGNLPGWPRPLGSGSDASRYITGSGGEVSPRLYDIDGDNDLEVVQGTSSGELYVLRADGSPLPSFNGGRPVTTGRYATEQNHPAPAGLPTPHESMRVPAIGDIDGDREPEIVASAGEHVYAWEADGTQVSGFPVRIDPALSEPCIQGVPKPCFDFEDRAIRTDDDDDTRDNHIKRGIFGSVALADLDEDGRLDIVSGSMDQHVYAWDGTGQELDGFPTKLESDGADGAEIVATPAIADLDGEGPPEIVIPTNEVIPGSPEFPGGFFEFFGAALRSSTGANPVYALHGDGTSVEGWPVTVPVAAGDLLPLVLPSHDAAVLDDDTDGNDEVSVSGGTGVIGANGAFLADGDGSVLSNYTGAGGPNVTDQSPILNLADHASIGDLSGLGNPLVLKGGLTANGAANLLAVNQNLPFNHVEQAFDPTTGSSAGGFPRATDDFQLVSQASVARVAGSGPGAHALVGTGLYQVHAYDLAGLDAPGWPKFTGGWTQTTPAVGDADGDGDLDVSVVTREGWSFLWDTETGACGGANDEWPSFHHDEFNSANYGTDARPPGTPEDLTAADAAAGAVDLSWTAPGDDWLCEDAEAYELRVSATPITKPSDGRKVAERPATAGPGDTETDTLTAAEIGDARFAAVLYRDDAGNWGRLASVRVADDPAEPGPGPDPDPGPTSCADVTSGTGGADRLRGTGAAEGIRGGAGNDRIRGREGNDCLNGNGGDDRVRGDGGKDRVKGGAGADRLRGGGGKDKLNGGDGDDRIDVRGGGRDKVACGDGKDRVRADRKDVVKAGDCERVGSRSG